MILQNNINNINNIKPLFNYGQVLNILLQTKLHSVNDLVFKNIQVKIDAQIYTLTQNFTQENITEAQEVQEFQKQHSDFCNRSIDLVSTDSRLNAMQAAKNQQLIFENLENLKNLENITLNAIFIALVGENMDAHDYMHDLHEKGYQLAITERAVENCPLPQIIVPNSLQALQMLAKAHCQSLDIPIVAVLGSNGKTTTKEMVAHLFKSSLAHAFATQGNLNNHIGVPLSLLRIRSQHQAAVLEIGMNHMGETSILGEMVAPDVSIITNAQREHQEFMLNVENVAREHALIAAFTKKVLVVPYQPEFLNIWQKAAEKQGIECHVFGKSADLPSNLPVGLTSYTAFEFAEVADISEQSIYKLHLKSQMQQNIQNNIENNVQNNIQATIHLNLLGTHNAYNATAVWAAFNALGFDMFDISKHFSSYRGFRGRLQMVQQNPWVIDDTYNANPDSVLAAVAAVADLKKNLLQSSAHPNLKSIKSLCILGDMGEVGEDGALYHQEIGQKAYAVFDGLITVGALSKASSDAWNELNLELNLNNNGSKNQALHFANHQEAMHFLEQHQNDYQLFLLKGSRFMRMETLLAAWAALEKA